MVIIGATMAGVCAAIRAAREGLSVILTSSGDGLGGSFPSLGALETHYAAGRASVIDSISMLAHMTLFAPCTSVWRQPLNP